MINICTYFILDSTLNNEGQTFKILPHIKGNLLSLFIYVSFYHYLKQLKYIILKHSFIVLGGEGFTSISNSQDNTSFVDELTPDRLLEMPIIIAADTQEEGQDSQLKVSCN